VSFERWLKKLSFSLRVLLHRREVDQELDDEIRYHIEARTEENIAKGMTPEEARRAARIELGGVEQVKENVRSVRTGALLETFLQDMRFGLRMLRKNPGFTAIAVLTLALGIGANAAIFSAVNGILLRQLPYSDASQLVTIEATKTWKIAGRDIMGSVVLSSDVWEQVEKQTPAIGRMAPYENGALAITGDAAPEEISAVYVSNDFFPLLGVRPLAGRPILAGDTEPGARPVAVATYALWRERWGGDARAIGRSIVLNQKAYTLIGVMPPQFDFGLYSQAKGVWVPNVANPGKLPESSTAVARLKKGVTLEGVNAQLRAISPRFSKDLSRFGSGMTFGASSVQTNVSDLSDALLALLGAVGFVLLIACVNVSGLLLARGWARQREIAIREALGASSIRIVRQLLTESVLLALGGGALGLLFSIWGVHVLRAITPADLPEHGHFDLNSNILWFTLAVSLLTGILFGLAPAMQASSRRSGTAIRDGFGSLAGTSSRRPWRLRSVLVVVEIALAVILVIGATLVARSFEKLSSVKLGFRTDHIITMDANLGIRSLPGSKAAVFDVLDRMRRISGVQDAAVTSVVPLRGPWSVADDLKIEGHAEDVGLNAGALIASRSVSPDYFRAYGISLLSGRGFTNADTADSQKVAIVDATLAEKYLGNRALGRRISAEKDKKGNPEWAEIVGVVQNARDTDLFRPTGEVYFPYAQADHFQGANFVVRTSANPALVLPTLRRAVWSEDKEAPITDVETMDQIVSDRVAEPRFQAILLGSFGGLGLILAIGGIYGVVSYGVTQRTREIGLRLALGAQRGNVLRMVIREGITLAGLGIVIGVAGALALTRFLQSLLFEVKPTDPTTFACVGLLLLIVAVAACGIPARRAMRIDPMVALRYE
jgi:putative ABC transport system permease protein